MRIMSNKEKWKKKTPGKYYEASIPPFTFISVGDIGFREVSLSVPTA